LRKLVLNEIEVDNFCKECGSCCKNLNLQDKIELTEHFGIAFTEDVCRYSSKYGCIKYANRSKYCKDWNCGAVEMLRSKLK
jgi:uncharacterized cysteine cluster protein YcgN (CxxCxxCC family)